MKKVILFILLIGANLFGKVTPVRVNVRPAPRPVIKASIPRPTPKVVNVKPSVKTAPSPTFKSLPVSKITPTKKFNSTFYNASGSTFERSSLNNMLMYYRPVLNRNKTTSLYDEYEREYSLAKKKYDAGIISKETFEAYEKLLILIKKHL